MMEHEHFAFTGLTLLVGLLMHAVWKSLSQSKRIPVPIACPNPHCVRCVKYRQVQEHAQKRSPWVAKEVKQQSPNSSLDRVLTSIKEPQRACTPLQAPTVLMVADLHSQEVVTEYHPQACQALRNDQIHAEILKEVGNTSSLLWNMNDSPKGSWMVLPLLNQGSWDSLVVEACPNLYKYVQGIPNLMDGCLFGNVMISKLHPGTCIEPHCGPTNARHRLQYALQIPKSKHHSELFLQVGVDHVLKWKAIQDVFVFDDSFVHSVSYENTTEDKDNDESASNRIVLIIDLWHPDLSPAERMLIQHLYPPLP